MTESYTAFTSGSYWRKPLGAAPLDAESDAFIAWLKANVPSNMRLSSGDLWAMPIYWSKKSDPLRTVNLSGNTVKVRIPRNVAPMGGNDAAMLVIDRTTKQDVQFFEYDPETITATGGARYWLNSEGLDERVGGTAGNFGHRGLPGTTHAIRIDELAAGLVPHRTKFAIPQTRRLAEPTFPMAGQERDTGGLIFEGIVIRVKASVNLVERGLAGDALTIAQHLKDYGSVVGDTSGNAAVLKCERGTGVPAGALAALTWDDFEFVKRGWR